MSNMNGICGKTFVKLFQTCPRPNANANMFRPHSMISVLFEIEFSTMSQSAGTCLGWSFCIILFWKSAFGSTLSCHYGLRQWNDLTKLFFQSNASGMAGGNTYLIKENEMVASVRNILNFVLGFNNSIMARTVTVALGQHYEDFIQANIASGRYNNVSEVIRAALRRLEEDELHLAALRSAIDEGDASADVVAFNEDSFIEEMREGWRKKNG